ncbi:hypothetical protein KY289_016953 [Solanum tuberosum]|nr:hypothetical protein KY284_016743 [Solanum tuberosum]KAH0689595.1 hypothetical protein KY289_016953 [Solanum tuberosum]
MRGANQSQVNVSELEAVKSTSEVDIVENSAERAKEQQRKEKGKLELSHSKGDKRKYITRSEAKKVMGSAIAASKAHTERTRKRKRERLKPEHPASTPLSIVNSESESEDDVKGKKSTAKNAKVKRQTSLAKGEKGRKQSEEQPVKRPGPKIKDQIEEKDLTRKER